MQKTCPFICNEKLSGPKRSIKITDHFTCTSANVIYCITCTFCKKLYQRIGDRFREHLRDVEKDDKNASKPVARHFNLVNGLNPGASWWCTAMWLLASPFLVARLCSVSLVLKFAVHHQLTNHNIDWDSAQCLTYSTSYFQRLTLESWYTNLEQTPLNRSQQLPAPYKRLIRDENKTDKRTSDRPT